MPCNGILPEMAISHSRQRKIPIPCTGPVVREDGAPSQEYANPLITKNFMTDFITARNAKTRDGAAVKFKTPRTGTFDDMASSEPRTARWRYERYDPMY